MRNRIILSLCSTLLFASGVSPCVAETASSPAPAAAADALSADKAWQDILDASRPPNPPAEWNNHTPSATELAEFAKKRAELAEAVADRAKDFYTKYPNHPKAAEAKEKEEAFRHIADSQKPAPPAGRDDVKFMMRVNEIKRAAMNRSAEGTDVVIAQLESGVRALLKEFPDHPESYDLLYQVAANSNPEKSRALAQEIIASNAGTGAKEAAGALLKKMDMVGHPVELRFTAVDGREVDLEKLKGKVVLIDFWATWCAPCVGELPNVKEAYSRLHDKGFEIVSISFDQSKEQLEKFLKKEKMEWPQYFDGKGWENVFGQKFGINAIPAMWLVDKKGNVRDLNAREDLAGKVERMLGEN